MQTEQEKALTAAHEQFAARLAEGLAKTLREVCASLACKIPALGVEIASNVDGPTRLENGRLVINGNLRIELWTDPDMLKAAVGPLHAMPQRPAVQV